jgi:hypothetical protein
VGESAATKRWREDAERQRHRANALMFENAWLFLLLGRMFGSPSPYEPMLGWVWPTDSPAMQQAIHHDGVRATFEGIA